MIEIKRIFYKEKFKVMDDWKVYIVERRRTLEGWRVNVFHKHRLITGGKREKILDAIDKLYPFEYMKL